MTDVLVRRATRDDLDALTRLFIELSDNHRPLQPDNPRYALPEERWYQIAEQSLSDSDVEVVVAELTGKIVGFGRAAFGEKPWGTSCEITTMVVEEGNREAGIGTRLLAALEDLAAARNVDGLRVQVLLGNERASRFYEQKGYKPLSIRYGKEPRS